MSRPDDPTMFYAVLASYSHTRLEFRSIHPTLDAAKHRVDFEVESAKRIAASMPHFNEGVYYLVIEVPIAYVGSTRK